MLEMFERYAAGIYSDMQIAEWLNAQGYRTNRGIHSVKILSGICCVILTILGKIRYRGMTVRPKGVSFRSTPPKFSEGQHEPIVTEEFGSAVRRCVPAGV